MALRAYTPERRAVTTVKGEVLGEIRGLSLEDVAALLREHLPDLEAIVELFKSGAAEAMSADDWMKLALPVITQAPGLAANAIALAADEPTGAEMVKSWPFSVQLAALIVVFEMTFSEIGEVKKLPGIIAALRTTVKTKVERTTKTRTKAS